jgi:hypothetical protein
MAGEHGEQDATRPGWFRGDAMNETQPFLFDSRPAPADVRLTDPNVHPAKVRKLGGDCKALYDALRWAGKAGLSTADAAKITHRFSARKLDLIKAGYRIERSVDEHGNSRYYLVD